MNDQSVYGYMFEGKRFDCGSKLGYLKATIEYALEHKELSKEFRNYLKKCGLIINSFYDKDKKRLNTVIKNFKGNSRSLVFNSHIDTVKPILEEWNTNPFNLKITKVAFFDV